MRYALYFTPPPSDALAKIASNWLGRNAFSNEKIRRPHSSLMDEASLHRLTLDPRRYGFHATLKAPFRLNSSFQEADLVNALIEFTNKKDAFTVPRLKIHQLGRFFALVPSHKNNELDNFANEVVKFFDPFRADLSEEDIARRRPETLTDKQREYLKDWGYPYVFDEFRFHMTLTGPVEEAQQDKVRRILDDFFAPVLSETVEISNLALFVERESGEPFEVHSLHPLVKPYSAKRRAGQQ